jgi:hypothetical protein
LNLTFGDKKAIATINSEERERERGERTGHLCGRGIEEEGHSDLRSFTSSLEFFQQHFASI